MDANIQKALHDKLYDKRKVGALELEKLVRDALAANNHEKIARVIDQLCHDYAYSIHQPYARNGGLIGLAAASIALGPDVARHLEQIVPPVLACFTDQDARVRYYACESMYNISKTSKGEILPYFNEIFDALAKLAADTEPSVKNGAELLDRLIKDIVSESATSYVSVLHDEKIVSLEEGDASEMTTAFSLARFMPLLQERIFVLNPFTRMFLVSWITLLDSIPDLEVVSYLPSFLGGLFKFLSDKNQDVVTATQHVLEKFLEEIKLVATVNRDLTEAQRGRKRERDSFSKGEDADLRNEELQRAEQTPIKSATEELEINGSEAINDTHSSSSSSLDEEEAASQENWIPGQDVHVDYPKILEILVTFLNDASEDHLQLTALRWIDSFFEICPEEILTFVPTLLDHVLPALSNEVEQVRVAGAKVNTSLMEYIVGLSDKEEDERKQGASVVANSTVDAQSATEKPDSSSPAKGASATSMISANATESQPVASLDYEAAVNALTTQFMNENEATRAAALSWLIMLQKKAPKKVLAAHDGTFPTLLQTLSDPSDTVVTRDLQLLSQISKHSDDSFFAFFMINLLKLFSNDRKLLETRGNLIIRQLCTTLSPERIYRIMADCIEKEEDSEFASIMVQNLNNNLITAPELSELRKKLRGWEFRVGLPQYNPSNIYKSLFSSSQQDGQTLFVALFRAWCHNSVATISLCLLAQAYEQAYNLLQIFADVEMTVATLIQIDKLVQLLESPVFTYLRLQLLEPSQYPFLYKTLYGILMLLPQSAAFAALKNRLNSVSAIGYLHFPSTGSSSSSNSTQSTLSRALNPSSSGTARAIKAKEDSVLVKWNELLEKFKQVQDGSSSHRFPNQSSNDGAEVGLFSSSSSSTTRKQQLQFAGAGTPGGQVGLGQRLIVGTDLSGTSNSTRGGAAGIVGLGSRSGTLIDGNNANPANASSSSFQGQGQSQGSGQAEGKEKEHKKSFSQSHLHRLAAGVRGKTKK